MDLEIEGAAAPATDTPPPVADTATQAPLPAQDAESSEAAGPTVDDTLAKTYEKLHPGRDEHGRFKPRDGATDAAPATNPDQAQTLASEQAKPAIEMPKSWSADRAKLWDTAPPELREIIANRETEAHKQISQQGQLISAFEPYVDILEQAGSYGEPIGMGGGEYLQNLINADRLLNQDPMTAIQSIAQAYDIDLTQFGGQQYADGQESSPQVHGLLNKIAQLEARLNETTQHVQTREHREAQAQFQTLEGQVAEFSKDKADFKDVADDVVDQIRALKANPATARLPHAELLAKAYDKARWANPAVRERLLKEQQAAAEKQRTEEAQRRAAEAKRSGSVNVRGSVANGSAPKSVDDTLRETYKRIHAS
jgi:hypothetical protein